MKCKNCGKLKKNHYKGTGINPKKGGEWCYPVLKFNPNDERYFMRFVEK